MGDRVGGRQGDRVCLQMSLLGQAWVTNRCSKWPLFHSLNPAEEEAGCSVGTGMTGLQLHGCRENTQGTGRTVVGMVVVISYIARAVQLAEVTTPCVPIALDRASYPLCSAG